ncbi:MAG: metal-dependent hydrolase [Planctomycetota bacterium]
MDNITHSLTGLALARAGGDRLSKGATVILIVTANLPDAEMFFQPDLGPGSYLLQHRGVSHSFFGMAILALLFPALVWLVDGFLRRRLAWRGDPPKLRGLMIAAALGLSSHLFLDWINTYGIRLLLPFDDRWFYGDIAYIIDPWIWLMLLTAGAWVQDRSSIGDAFWVLVAIGMSLVVFLTDRAGLAVQLVWLGGLLAVLAIRLRGGASQPLTARVALGAMALHLVLLFGLGRMANGIGDEELKSQGVAPLESSAFPVAAVPWQWEHVARDEDRIYRSRVDVLDGSVTGTESVSRNSSDPRLNEIRDTLAYRAFRVFYRYPYVEPAAEEAWPIWLRDARYSWGKDAGFSDLRLTKPEPPPMNAPAGR